MKQRDYSKRKKKKNQKHIAFSISAGCYFYQMGVANYLQRHFDLSDIMFSGASGGSWPATLLASGEDIKDSLEVLLRFAPDCCQGRYLGAYGVYHRGMRDVYNRIYCGKDVPQLVKNKLAISVTRFSVTSPPFFTKDEVITDFHSNDDVISCIIASALIPFALTGYPCTIYRNWICVDGGVTNVTGVRRFAAALAHDMELLEEEFVEQTTHLSERLAAMEPVVLQDLPMVSDPYGTMSLSLHIVHTVVSSTYHNVAHAISSSVETTVGDWLSEMSKHLVITGGVSPSSGGNDIPILVDASAIPPHTECASFTSQSRESMLEKTTSYVSSVGKGVCDKLWGMVCAGSDGVGDRGGDRDKGETGPSALTRDWVRSSPLGRVEDPLVREYIASSQSWPSVLHVMGGGASEVKVSPYSASRGRHASVISRPPCTDKAAGSTGPVLKADAVDACQSSASEGTGLDGVSSRSISLSSVTDNQVVGRSRSSDGQQGGGSISTDSGDSGAPLSEEEAPSAQGVVDGEVPVNVLSVAIPSATGRVAVGSESDDCGESSLVTGGGGEGGAEGGGARVSKDEGVLALSGAGSYWKVKAQLIKRTPDGGLLLEIAPWTWRQHPVLSYHLTSDMDKCRRLFEIGMLDAAEHHYELMEFFTSK